jgi:predicted ATPase
LVTNPLLLKEVNEWLSSPSKLGTHYRLAIRTFVEVDEILRKTRGRTRGSESSTGRRLEAAIKAHAANVMRELAMVDDRAGVDVSARDVGLGLSQILPVLVHALGSQRQIHCIEQPELHLHPALQADLADVFIESALGERKNRFLLETHSEHLILRILRRIRETAKGTQPKDLPPIRPNDVAVLYVEASERGSIVREMEVNERGEFVKAWPGGFFEEGLRETLA